MSRSKAVFQNPFTADVPSSPPSALGVAEPLEADGPDASPEPEVSPAPTADGAEFRVIALANIRESDTNPRKVFAAGPMADLVASVKESGVHMPIVVRPIRGDRVPAGQFELVAGARRLRAAKAAGLSTIPALIRDMTDVQVLELQVIENNQREDVHPIEEGQAIAALQARGIDLGAIAHKIGRHLTYVTKRLQLTRLHTYFQDLWTEKAAIGVEQALIIARLSPAQQKLLRDECKKSQWMIKETLRDSRRLREYLAEAFERELADVSWSLSDPDLLPKAGACNTCPKRSGAQAALFDDVKKDTCLDPECFAAKRDAFVKLQISALAKKDPAVKPVLVTVESSYGKKRDDGAVSKWGLDEITPAQAKKIPAAELRTGVLVDGEDAGKTIIFRATKPQAGSTGPTEAEKRRREKAKVEEAFNYFLLGKIISTGDVLSVLSLRVIALKLFERLWDDSRAKIASRHGWQKPANAGYSDWRAKAAQKYLETKVSTAAVAEFAIECALIGLMKVDGDYGGTDNPKKLRAIAKDLGVDVDEARAAFDAQAGASPAKPAKPGKKAKVKR